MNINTETERERVVIMYNHNRMGIMIMCKETVTTLQSRREGAHLWVSEGV